MEMLGQAARRVVGIEPSKGMLRLAAKRTPAWCQLVRAYSRSLPVATSAADLCMSARSLSHESDLHRAVREVARVLRPMSGRWIVADVHAAHRYCCTTIPAEDKCVPIETYKRAIDDIVEVARANALVLESQAVLSVADLDWIPPDLAAHGIEGLDDPTPIFYVLAFRRGAAPPRRN